MKFLDNCTKAYLAGFLDGDGCINAQIIKRKNYKLGFQIRVSITFFQSSKRHWFLLQIEKMLPGGTVRKRIDGISEYCIVGPTLVQAVCKELLPFLKIKQKQATLVLDITKQLRKNQSLKDFLCLCNKADQIGALNDSKKRKISAAFVQTQFQTLFPVETSNTTKNEICETRDTFSG